MAIEANTSIREEKEVETRGRLIAAAGEAFAEAGFEGATVRDICRRAGANVAAVNYHFKDKRELYLAVFAEANCAAISFSPEQLLAAPLPTREKIGLFVRGFLGSVFAEGKPAWAGKLMAREMMEPTEALDAMVNSKIRPMFAVLRALVAEATGADAESELVRYAGASIIAQCLFYKHSVPVVRRLYPDMTFDTATIEKISEHVVAFSWVGLEGLKQEVKRGKAH